MARQATSKTGKKNAQKGDVSALDKAESALQSIHADIATQKQKLRSARDALREKRTVALARGTQAARALVERAHARVAGTVIELENLDRKAHIAKAEMKVAKILHQARSVEEQARTKALALEAKLVEQAEHELTEALKKFQARWRKRRALADRRKLQAETRKGLSKIKLADKKAQTEIRSIERKVAKVISQPVKAPGRPGRPRKGDDAKAAPKKRGRPSKAATDVGQATAKRRGRPPKPATDARAVSIPKKRGRPAKAASAVALGDTPKKRGRPAKAGAPANKLAAPAKNTVTAKKTLSETASTKQAPIKKAGAPKRGRPAKTVAVTALAQPAKRRGRPPKAK